MEKILQLIESRFNGITKRLDAVEARNEALWKEVIGLKSNLGFSSTIINSPEVNSNDQPIVKERSTRRVKFVDANEEEEAAVDESNNKFGVVSIRSKTSNEEQNRLKAKFIRLREKLFIQDGDSIRERNIQTISNSIPLNYNNLSCVLKISNHLNCVLEDPNFLYDNFFTSMTGPSAVAPHVSEVYIGSGLDFYRFLCTFSINASVRLATSVSYDTDCVMGFDIGFITNDAPTDKAVQKKRDKPGVWDLELSYFHVEVEESNEPMEIFHSHGDFLVRGHMESTGPRALVHIDILEVAKKNISESANAEANQMAVNCKQIRFEEENELRKHNALPSDEKIELGPQATTHMDVVELTTNKDNAIGSAGAEPIQKTPIGKQVAENRPFNSEGKRRALPSDDKISRSFEFEPWETNHIDIVEITKDNAIGLANTKAIENTPICKQMSENKAFSLEVNNNTLPSQDKISCSVEIVNLLNVTLRKRKLYYCKSKHNNFIPNEVRPNQTARFFASDEKTVEGMFSYGIDTTDLIIIFKAQGKKNSFAGALFPFNTHMNPDQLRQCIDSQGKSAKAKDGKVVVEIRKIRAVISMTEGEKSELKIHLSAF